MERIFKNNLRIQKGSYRGKETEFKTVNFITIDNPDIKQSENWYEITITESTPFYKQFEELYNRIKKDETL